MTSQPTNGRDDRQAPTATDRAAEICSEDETVEAAPNEVDVLDLGDPSEDVEHPIAGKRYDPGQDQEKIRGRLALAAFGLFAIFSLAVAAAIISGRTTWDDVEGMTGALLPAIVSVVGTTTGFYFGTKSKQDG